MKKFKKFTMACVGLMSAGILGACGSNDEVVDSSGVAEENNELSIAVWGYDTNPEFKAVVEAFEKEHEGVEVKIIDIDAGQYEDKITTMLSSQDKTDVLAMKDVGSYVGYASKDQLIELSDVAESIDAAENFNGNLEGYAIDDEYYALPFRKDTYLLFYNKDLFDEQGVEYPETLTWDEYESLAKEMTFEKDGQANYGTYHHTWFPILFGAAANQNDVSLTDGEYGFAEDYLDRWVRMQDEGVAMDYASIKTASVTYSSQFETAKTAMMPMGSFYLGKLINAKNEGKTDVNWAVTSIPQKEKDEIVTFGGPTGFAVSKHSENQELAKEFVAFSAGEEGAKAVANTGVTPAYESEDVLDVLYNLDGMPQDEQSRKALQPDKNGWEFEPNSKASDVRMILKEEYDLIMVEDNSVEKGLSEITKRVSEIE